MKNRTRLAWCLSVLLLTGCGAAPRETDPPAPQEEIYIDETEIIPAPRDQVETVSKAEDETPPAEQALPPEPEAEPLPAGTDSAEALSSDSAGETSPAHPEEMPAVPAVKAGIEAETVVLSRAPAAVPEIAEAEASGEKVHESERAVIDYSHTGDGYVMVRCTDVGDKRLRTQVKGPSSTYTYEQSRGRWEVFPLSDGNGSYQISVYENVKDTSYALVTSASIEVYLQDEFAPYLLPNQYVNYTAGSRVVARAAELAGQEPDTLKKVELIYDFVVETLTYDTQKAAHVKTGYVPVLDTVLAEEKGICFDYAALMTGMLRSQGVPCKLVVGYAGTAYHAWISVWSPETGWVDGAIFFNGSAWQRMDPTFASSGNRSESVMQFIGDGKNYTAKYFY